MEMLKTGILAYYDSMQGNVPVKVLSVAAPKEKSAFDLGYGEAKASISVEAEVTVNHSPYKKGEIIKTNSIYVFPRGSLRKHEFSMTIAPYAVQVDAPKSSVKQQEA